jgi:hypothetical protein
MKTHNRFFNFFAMLEFISATATFAQTPANDDFANRTVFTGSSTTFTGSLAGATVETNEPNRTYYGIGASGSVWWTWTAPASTTVVIWFSSPQSATNRLAVYTGNTLGGLTLITDIVPFPPPGLYVSLNAAAGTTYQIQVIGADIRPFSAQLTATNTPVFIFQPKDCIVSPYGSAVFSALASKPPPLLHSVKSSYQWYFNGTPILGQIYPSLLIHAVTTNQAGTYSVTASNIGGVTAGGSATLTVIDTNPVPSLSVLPPNGSNLQFNLTGEPGRWYKVESSTDLQNWVNPTWMRLTNPTTLVAVQRLAPTHFVRASLDVPTEICVAQIKQMNWAGLVWGIDTLQLADAPVTASSLAPYLPLDMYGRIPVCPEGGTYWFGAVTNPAWCTLTARGHRIPDP